MTTLSEPAGVTRASRPGTTVAYSKYTSFGNTFIIVDETDDPLADDGQRAVFARWALNGDFGIGGADNVLYLRRTSDSSVVFRIFEYDGSETLSCGNGLLSSAAYLHRETGGMAWTVLTELPSGRPKAVRVGVADTPDARDRRGSRGTWVDAGWPRPASPELYRRQGPPPATAIDEVPALTIPLPQGQPWAGGLPETITLTGLLTFTGEPHLILFEGHGYPAELAPGLWVDATAGGQISGIGLPDTPEMAASRALVHHLGSYVNQHYRELFPQGVHLNFARITGSGAIEYRTWERAIDRETLACGSGTIAMAHVGRGYGILTGTNFTFWPHRCRWYQPDAALEVSATSLGFVLAGRPELICEGTAAHPPLLPVGERH
jgi:diaminopimelate epimerase